MAEDSFTLHLTASSAPGTLKPKGRKTTTKKQRRKAASLKYAANAKPQLKLKKGVVVARPAAEPASVPRRRDKPAAPPAERAAPPSTGFGTRKDRARVPDKQYGAFHLSAEELSRPRPALIAPARAVPVKEEGEGFASLGVGAALCLLYTSDAADE